MSARTDKILQAKETIKNWLSSKNYPSEFLNFFFRWTLLNLYYNALASKNKESDRVREFGKRYEKLFDNVKNSVIELIKTECVGNGKDIAPPNGRIKTASLQLRKILNIDFSRVCAACRIEKRKACKRIKTEQCTYGRMEALMIVLYQIRCNLFHGDKTEYENGEQAERNKLLVNLGNKILEKILHSLI